MRKNFGPKSWLYPMPVLIIATYNEDKTADAMNAAWGAISQSNHISICVSAGHKTTQNILARKAFTVSMADAAHVVACDYVGVVSGNNEPVSYTHLDVYKRQPQESAEPQTPQAITNEEVK